MVGISFPLNPNDDIDSKILTEDSTYDRRNHNKSHS